MQERLKKATEAYNSILMAPREEGENGWFPPPRQMADKKWSKELRCIWPGYTSVRLSNKGAYTEKMNWCKENAQFFWTAGNELMWYFSDRDTALIFKLKFGGIVE